MHRLRIYFHPRECVCRCALEVEPFKLGDWHRRGQSEEAFSDWEQGFSRVQPRCKALQGPGSQGSQNRVSQDLLSVQCQIKSIIACTDKLVVGSNDRCFGSATPALAAALGHSQQIFSTLSRAAFGAGM